MDDFLSQLQNVANKLRHMWGNNPDSDLIEEAVKRLTPAEAEASTEETTTRRTRTKG